MMDEGGGEMTTIAINEENSPSQALMDAFKTGDVTSFAAELENVVLNSPLEVFESFLNEFTEAESDLKWDNSSLLHILAKLLKHSDYYEKTSECIKIALNHGLDINEPDERNQTPFFYLLKFQPKFPNNELINYILDNYEVDFYNFQADKMKNMFEKQNNERKIPEKIGGNLTYAILMSKLHKKNYSQFLDDFKAFKVKNQKTSQNGNLINLSENPEKFHKISEMPSSFQDKCSHFLYAAVKRNLLEIVNLLIDEGIDIDRIPNSFKDKRSPIFLAASYGHFKVFEVLLKKHPNLTHARDGNILHTILHASYQNKSKNPNVDHQKCFELAALASCDINELDNNGQSPLHYAVHHRNNSAVLALLESGADITRKNNLDETPLDDMRKEVLEEFLDERIKLIQVPEDKEQKEVTIGIDLKFLSGHKSEVEPLELIYRNRELRPLIQHPTLASFIFLKWTRYSFIFYTNFLLFTFLISALIGFILFCHIKIEEGRNLLKFLSLLAILFLAAREIFQFLLSTAARINYFKSFVNIFEILLIIFGILMQLNEETFSVENWKVLRSLTILFSAFEILHLVGDLPIFTISTNMVIFGKVGLNYLKSMLLYFILIIAFAFTFFVLYGGEHDAKEPDVEFNNFMILPIALVKVVTMGVGEFDASNLSLTSKSWFYWVIFLAFVFLIPIVLFNVLCALAVDDIQKIKAQGELTDLIARIKVLSRYEKMMNSNFLNFLSCWKKLRNFVTLFPHFLVNEKLVVAPNKRFAILRSKSGKSESGCFGDSPQKCLMSCSRLDYKIGKKLRNIIENRKEQKIKEENESEVKNEMKSVREEMKEIKKSLKSLENLILSLRENY